MKKRGQITAFVIIGIVLLLGLAIVIYLERETTFFKPKEIVPDDVAPIKNYVESCMLSSLEPALDMLYTQGGYISFPLEVSKNPLNYVSLTDSIKVPFWYYGNTPKVPGLSTMQSNISEFVMAKTIECLDSFSAFQDEYEIIILDDIEIITSINEQDISLKAIYPLDIKKKGELQFINWQDYYIEKDSNLKKVHALATEIMRQELQGDLLANLTIEMVATGRTDKGKFPFEGMEIQCGSPTRYSIRHDLIPAFRNIIKYNLKNIRFLNTLNPVQPYEYYQKLYTFDPRGDYRNIETNFLYLPSFPLYMDIHPKSGDTVRAIKMDAPIIGSCIKLYHHFYDIEYPVLVQLKDLSNPEEPLLFNFAVPVRVEDNNPKRASSQFILDSDDRIATSELYCQDLVYNAEIMAVDKFSQEFIDNATIEYQCIRFKCELGSTDFPRLDNIKISDVASLSAKFPRCINGNIVASSPGYVTKTDILTINPGETNFDSYTVEMTPLKHFKYAFEVVEIDGESRYTRSLEDDEVVFLLVSNKDEDFENSLYYPIDVDEYSALELIPGDLTYDLDIKLIKGENLIGSWVGKWTVTRDELLGEPTITFRIPALFNPAPEQFADFEINQVPKESINYMPLIS